MLNIEFIGNRLKELRRQRGITQSAFAEQMHVSSQAVSNWERGIAPPDLENLLRIAQFFGILVDELLRDLSDRLILGIDGGGTKTEFVIATQSGLVLKQFTRDRSNPNDIGLQKATQLISDGIHDAISEFPSICACFCGMAGASTGNNRKIITEHLRERFPQLKFEILTDAENLFSLDDSADMAIISGTGAVVYLKQNEKLLRLGGWGYLLDDGGSAYSIGRDAITASLAEEEALLPESILSKKLRKRLGVSKTWDAVAQMYAEGKPFIASFAEVVFEAYAEGDEKAIAIIDKNAAQMAEHLERGMKIYGAGRNAITGGGNFEHHMDIISKHMKKYTDAVLLSSDLPPIYGACRKAMRIAELPIGEEFYHNFKNSYGGRT
jgi:N-acetylglucosamine kinase-like BadF-type ATPase